MFIDRIQIFVKAGNGGNGAVSFRREKYVSHGGPDGGDGGNGGNIVFRVDEGSNTLLAFRYKRKFIAEPGGNGMGHKCHGATAPDVFIDVPPGTLIRDAETGKIIHDMSDDDGKNFTVCRGGRGGWGNRHFATATRQVPMFAKNGTRGEEKELLLELKMLADVGLIGFPSVGKSSILSRISAAKPKIADYHFTTLSPNLGVVSTGEDGQGFVAADIPGLIEGASDGAGLGHEFLRHVDRCRLLLHVVDISGSEGRDPFDDFNKINHELSVFNEELSGRTQIVVGNKCDLIDEDEVSRIGDKFKEMGYAFFPVMAAIAEGTDELINFVAAELAKLPPIVRYEPEIVIEEPEINYNKRSFKLRVENGVFIIDEAEWLLKILETVDPEDYESLQYFQRVLHESGIIKALTKNGVTDGDIVRVYDIEFEYVS